MECPRCGLLSPPEALRCDCGWDFAASEMKASYLQPDAGPEWNLASLDDRLGGQVVDGGVAFAVGLVGALPALVSDDIGALTMPVGVAAALLYLLLADGLAGGQSIGKRWLHTAVIDASSGRPCTFGQSFVRNLTLMFLGFVDCLFILDASRRRLGDRLAGTVVVTTARAAVTEAASAGPALSDAELPTTRDVYAHLPTHRLLELMASPADLRPGAEELLREEFERRHEPANC